MTSSFNEEKKLQQNVLTNLPGILAVLYRQQTTPTQITPIPPAENFK